MSFTAWRLPFLFLSICSINRLYIYIYIYIYPNNTTHKCAACTSVCLYRWYLKKKKKRKKERKKTKNEISDVFFWVIFKERKIKVKKTERINESCDLLLATAKRKWKESRHIVGKAGWHHNRTGSAVFEFVYLTMYLLNVHWQQHGRERKREKVRESWFIIDTDYLIFLIILSLLHVSPVFITIPYEILFVCLFILFRFWNLFNLDYKKDILYKIQPSLLTGVF